MSAGPSGERMNEQPEPEWLTYAEAAERLNVSPHAVRMRANRFGWRKQMGNYGLGSEARQPDKKFVSGTQICLVIWN